MVVVHNAEVSAETDNSTGTTREKLLSEDLKELLSVFETTTGGSQVFSAIKGVSELSVVNRATTISVIEVEKHLTVLNKT